MPPVSMNPFDLETKYLPYSALRWEHIMHNPVLHVNIGYHEWISPEDGLFFSIMIIDGASGYKQKAQFHLPVHRHQGAVYWETVAYKQLPKDELEHGQCMPGNPYGF